MQESQESPVEHGPAHSLLRSRGFWIGAVLLAVLLALIFGYVEIRARDCRLLCGEQAGKNARFVVGGGIVRQSDKPVTGRCACEA